MNTHYDSFSLESLATMPYEATLIANSNVQIGDEIRLIDCASLTAQQTTSFRYRVTSLSYVEGKTAIERLLGEKIPFLSENLLRALTPYEQEFILSLKQNKWYTIAQARAVPDSAFVQDL